MQKYVCAEVQATRLFTGPQADRYLTQSAKVQGVPGNLIVSATKAFPFIPLSQQLHWLGSTPSDASSPIVKAYELTAKFLVGQGRLTVGPVRGDPGHPRRLVVRQEGAGRWLLRLSRSAQPPGPGVRPGRAASPGRRCAANVVLSGVGKTFRRAGRRTVALAGVDLEVRAGELVCLLGPSGCGKSTLLRIVAGALAYDQGAVTVGGRPVTGPAPDRGILFQSPMLFPWLTTRKNVLFGPKAQRSRGLHERDDPELDAEADAILATVGLSQFGDAFPHELSGGMQHRAAFARAMVTRPSLLLMDEPFGALDAFTRLRMHEFLLSMWERYRITIIFVTHDLEEAVLLGDRVAVMGGRPPGIREVIDVPLGRPRHALDVDTEQFLAVKRSIRAALTTDRGA